MAYLDTNGLKYLWGKLKTLFEQKLNVKYDVSNKDKVLTVGDDGNVAPKEPKKLIEYGGAFPQNPEDYKGVIFVFQGEDDEYPYISIKEEGAYKWVPISRVLVSLDVVKLRDADRLTLGDTP